MTNTDTALPSDRLRQWLATPRRMFIGGRWIDASKGQVIDVIDPASGEPLAQVPQGTSEDIDLAVNAAAQAFRSWRKFRPSRREKLLLALADALEARADELALLETLDNGKPITFSRHMDVALSVDFLRYTAGWATKIEGRTMTPSIPVRSRRP